MRIAHGHTGNTRSNHILAALPDAEWRRWQSQLELVDLQFGQVLCEAGDAPRCAWFPTTAAISLMSLTQEGESAEMALVANEGVVGVSLFMGGDPMTSRAMVLSAGQAYRLRAGLAIESLAQPGKIQGAVLRYAHALLSQVGQTALCNRRHSLEKQLCRRLLAGLDHLPANELSLTHQLVANLLGVRREGVTAAALKLRQDGVIRYSRGHITVLDRPRLEARACECYAAMKNAVPCPLPMALAA